MKNRKSIQNIKVRRTGKYVKKNKKNVKKTRKLPLQKGVRRNTLDTKKQKKANARSYKKNIMNKRKTARTTKAMKGGFSNPLPDIDLAASLNYSFQNILRGGMDVTQEHTFTDPSIDYHPRMEESVIGGGVVGDEPSTFFAN